MFKSVSTYPSRLKGWAYIQIKRWRSPSDQTLPQTMASQCSFSSSPVFVKSFETSFHCWYIQQLNRNGQSYSSEYDISIWQRQKHHQLPKHQARSKKLRSRTFVVSSFPSTSGKSIWPVTTSIIPLSTNKWPGIFEPPKRDMIALHWTAEATSSKHSSFSLSLTSEFF